MRRVEVRIGTVAAFGLAGAGLLAPAWAADPGPTPAVAPAPAKVAITPEKAAPQLARPPLPPVPPPPSLPWERHLEIGADLAVVVRPGSRDPTGLSTPIRLRPAPAWGIHLGWQVLRYLHFSGYFIGAAHELDQLPPGSFGQTGVVFASETAHTYVFGARVMPTYPFTDRLRAFAIAGAGWGKIAYPRLQVTEGAHPPFTIHERNAYLVELPVGLGVSYEIIPHVLNLDLSFTGAFLLSQQGEALQKSQAIDYAGKKRSVGAAPELDGSFVQTLGVSLIL
ncbi:MAG: hypothetical protein ABI193_19395 [Minicystis sp.]